MEDEAKKREQARMRLIQQAEQRRQKEIEERKKYVSSSIPMDLWDIMFKYYIYHYTDISAM